MSHWKKVGGFAVAAMLLTVGCVEQKPDQAPQQLEVNYWEKYKGDCENALNYPHSFELEDVTRCVKLWEMYREVSQLTLEVRSKYAMGFSRVWHETKDPYEREIAKAALARICVPLHPYEGTPDNGGKVVEKLPAGLVCGVGVIETQTAGGGTTTSVVDEWDELRATYMTVEVETPREKKVEEAQDLKKKAYKQFEKGKYADAAELYEQALDVYPFYVGAKYDLACAYAKFGADDDAIDQLVDLYSWDDAEVIAKMKKARTDPDLVSLHDDMRFKVITGYRRLALLNGAGEFGAEDMERLQADLTAKDLTPYTVSEDKKNVRLNPVIFYRKGFKKDAEDLKTLVGSKKTELAEITWDTLDDLIVIWGEDDAIALKSAVDGPIIQGTRAEGGDSDPLGEITGAVEDAQGQAEDAKGTAEGVGEVAP